MSQNPAILLSIGMIVKNEEAILPRCLDSIQGVADEIVIVDTGSTDTTVAIAHAYNAKVILSDWRDDFAFSRNISIKHATGRWILWLDADDVVPASSVDILRRLKNESADKVFAMVVQNQKPNGTGTEFLQARMFPRHEKIFFERPIHEQVMPSALRLGLALVQTTAIIEHHGYADPATMKKKAKRNVTMLLQSVDIQANDPFTMIEIADSYQIAEETAAALEWYKKIVATASFEKDFPVITSQAYLGLGNIFNRTENFAQALPAFRSAHRLCPERTDVLYCMAVAHDMLGDKKESINLLNQAISSQQTVMQVGIDFRLTEIKSILRLARLLHEEKEYKTLSTLCTQALSKWGTRPEIINMTGTAFFQMGRTMDALHAFEKSLENTPQGNIDAYIGLCVIYLKAGSNDHVITTLHSIEPLFSTFVRFWAFYVIAGMDTLEHVAQTILSSHSVGVKEFEDEVLFLKKTYNLVC